MSDWAYASFGWFCGAAAMWFYFKTSRLIRSKAEWHRARRPPPTEYHQINEREVALVLYDLADHLEAGHLDGLTLVWEGGPDIKVAQKLRKPIEYVSMKVELKPPEAKE